MQVVPFGPKLGQNEAPELRIIFQTLLGPQTLFKKSEKPHNVKIQAEPVSHRHIVTGAGADFQKSAGATSHRHIGSAGVTSSTGMKIGTPS